MLVAACLWVTLAAVAAGRRAVAELREGAAAAPVDVLAAPVVLRPRQDADPDALARLLRASAYRTVGTTPRRPGEFRLVPGLLEVYRRAADGPSGPLPAAFVRARLDGRRVVRLEGADGRSLAAFTLEPLRLGAFRGRRLEERRHRALSEFPPRLVEAVLAAEDARFFEHRGLDLWAIGRAAWADLRGGALLQGGSTITQQVIKNRLLGPERSWLRKAREAFLAAWVERRLDKKALLEIYLNEVYLGQRGPVSIVGIPAAARHWFGRDVRDLDLAQSALLAGMIASPGRFDPRRAPERARARRAWVLERMVELGFVDPVEAQAASAAPLGVIEPPEPVDPAGDVLDAVARELERRGVRPGPSRVAQHVHTAIDPLVQAAARRALRSSLAELERERPSRRPLEGALVVMRPATGEVIALIGGRDGTRGGFHRALDARRQPGSSFKPIVALAAFSSGRWAPASLIADTPFEIRAGGRLWRPSNPDGAFRGEVTLREALAHSLNVPFARLGHDLGVPAIVRAARAAGIDSPLPDGPSIALGTGEVRPIELARAYATIAALGVRHEPHVVRVVRSGDDAGPAWALGAPAAATRTLPSAACYQVLDALRGAVEEGTARRLAEVVGDVPVAAKTGTSQRGRDAWAVLVTGSAVAVVWIGRDDAAPAGLVAPRHAVPVLARLVAGAREALLAPLPPAPEDVLVVPWDPEHRCAARRPRRDTVREVFAAAHPPPECRPRSLWDRLFGRREPNARPVARVETGEADRRPGAPRHFPRRRQTGREDRAR
ncbi:MAG: bifunctional glycosyl transferase/transpeptidase [Acidobacteriota bacterium]